MGYKNKGRLEISLMVVTEEMKRRVKSEISISDYVYNVIVPEMPWYFDGSIVDFDLKPVIKCPLHGEDTPSFRYYPETNTYYCWGCGSGGDVIALHREFMKKIKDTNVSFDEAVSFLYNTFLLGKPAVPQKILTKEKAQGIEVSSNDKLLFKVAYSNVESKLQREVNMDMEDKVEVYKALDNAVKLSELGFIHPSDATVYVNTMFKQAIQKQKEKRDNQKDKDNKKEICI